MHIKLINRGEEGELLLAGRLDSSTAPEVEEIVLQVADRFDQVILNMA
jgi:anti-sigma B factor antagonist